jgi:hypothetical protein
LYGLHAAPRHHQRHLVGLLLNGVIQLQMKTLECRGVHTQVLFGSAKVLGQSGLRLDQIGRLQLHFLPRCHLICKRLPEYSLLHRQKNVMHIK